MRRLATNTVRINAANLIMFNRFSSNNNQDEKTKTTNHRFNDFMLCFSVLSVSLALPIIIDLENSRVKNRVHTPMPNFYRGATENQILDTCYTANENLEEYYEQYYTKYFSEKDLDTLRKMHDEWEKNSSDKTILTEDPEKLYQHYKNTKTFSPEFLKVYWYDKTLNTEFFSQLNLDDDRRSTCSLSY